MMLFSHTLRSCPLNFIFGQEASMALGPQSPASSATSVTLGGGPGAGIGGTVAGSGESARLTLDTNLTGAMLSPRMVETHLCACVCGRARAKGSCLWMGAHVHS